MIERTVITFFLIGISLGAFAIFKRQHIRRLGQMNTAVTNTPTILYFHSDTCAACPAQARFLEQVAQIENGRFTILPIDVQAEPEKAARHGVFTLPTTILIDAQGAVREINYGLTNPAKLQQQLTHL